MAMKKATLSVIIVIALMGAMVSALGTIVSTRTISSSGSIVVVGVGVYSDSGCTTVLSAINWGALNPGSTTTYTLYVKNMGDVSSTLNMTVNSWNPSTAPSYLKLTWNQEKTLLAVNQTVAAVLTLSVSSSIAGITSFSSNIVITGTH
jgi:hypothetical protein